MQALQLRRATAADATNIHALTRAAYAKWVPLIGREPIPMTADYDRAVVDHIIDLWEQNGELLALIEIVRGSDHLFREHCGQARSTGKGAWQQALGSCREACPIPESNAAFASNLSFYSRRGYQEYLKRVAAAGQRHNLYAKENQTGRLIALDQIAQIGDRQPSLLIN
jgi:hypothetical protein